MKKCAFVLLLLQTCFLLAAPSKPNPADFPMKIHIISSGSRSVYESSLTYTFQVLRVIIDGQQVELEATAGGVLALGDYPARISPTVHSPKNWSAYDTVKGYDFLMPDGKIRTYTVNAIGPPDQSTMTSPVSTAP